MFRASRSKSRSIGKNVFSGCEGGGMGVPGEKRQADWETVIRKRKGRVFPGNQKESKRTWNQFEFKI